MRIAVDRIQKIPLHLRRTSQHHRVDDRFVVYYFMNIAKSTYDVRFLVFGGGKFELFAAERYPKTIAHIPRACNERYKLFGRRKIHIHLRLELYMRMRQRWRWVFRKAKSLLFSSGRRTTYDWATHRLQWLWQQRRRQHLTQGSQANVHFRIEMHERKCNLCPSVLFATRCAVSSTHTSHSVHTMYSSIFSMRPK